MALGRVRKVVGCLVERSLYDFEDGFNFGGDSHYIPPKSMLMCEYDTGDLQFQRRTSGVTGG